VFPISQELLASECAAIRDTASRWAEFFQSSPESFRELTQQEQFLMLRQFINEMKVVASKAATLVDVSNPGEP